MAARTLTHKHSSNDVTKSARISIQIPYEIKERVRYAAALEGRTMTDYLVMHPPEGTDPKRSTPSR